jgi:hypothetical protein
VRSQLSHLNHRLIEVTDQHFPNVRLPGILSRQITIGDRFALKDMLSEMTPERSDLDRSRCLNDGPKKSQFSRKARS